MSSRVFLFVISLMLAAPLSVRADDSKVVPQGAQPADPVADKCEHGVTKSICTRCNPKLEAIFKAKNDWCAEHTRPESQCVICHPDLAKQGVK